MSEGRYQRIVWARIHAVLQEGIEERVGAWVAYSSPTASSLVDSEP